MTNESGQPYFCALPLTNETLQMLNLQGVLPGNANISRTSMESSSGTGRFLLCTSDGKSQVGIPVVVDRSGHQQPVVLELPNNATVSWQQSSSRNPSMSSLYGLPDPSDINWSAQHNRSSNFTLPDQLQLPIAPDQANNLPSALPFVPLQSPRSYALAALASRAKAQDASRRTSMEAPLNHPALQHCTKTSNLLRVSSTPIFSATSSAPRMMTTMSSVQSAPDLYTFTRPVPPSSRLGCYLKQTTPPSGPQELSTTPSPSNHNPSVNLPDPLVLPLRSHPGGPSRNVRSHGTSSFFHDNHGVSSSVSNATNTSTNGNGPRLASNKFRCGLCNVICWNQYHLDEHYKGRGHRRSIRQLQRRCVVVCGIPFPVMTQTWQQFFVGLNVDANAHLSFVSAKEDPAGPYQHVTFLSQLDAEKALAFTQRSVLGHLVTIRPATKPFECTACDIVLNSAEQYEQHLTGSKHKMRVETFLEESTVIITGLPSATTVAQIQQLFAGYSILTGSILPISPTMPPSHASEGDGSSNEQTRSSSLGKNFRITFNSPEEAMRVVQDLNGLSSGMDSISVVPYRAVPNEEDNVGIVFDGLTIKE